MGQDSDHKVRHVQLERDQIGQFVRIPKAMELTGRTVTIRKVADRLIVEPLRRKNLLEVLSAMEHLPPEDQFPDID